MTLEPAPRNLLDVGDGPLSLIFEALSTPKTWRALVSARRSCTSMRDVLVGWELRREAAPPTVEERAQLEQWCGGIMKLCALEYDALPADMCDSREYDALEKKRVLTLVRARLDAHFGELCRAAGRSRASVARLLGLNEFCGNADEPDLLGIYELELRVERRAIFAAAPFECDEMVLRPAAIDKSDYDAYYPTEYLGVFGTLAAFGELPLRVQHKMTAAGLVDDTPECQSRGRPSWWEMDDEVDEDDPLIEEVYLTEDDEEEEVEGAGSEPRVIVDEAALRWLSNEAESGRVDPSTLSRYTPLLEESQRRDAAARSVARAMRAFSESRSRVRAVTARNVQLAADLDLDDLASAAKRLDFGSVEAEL